MDSDEDRIAILGDGRLGFLCAQVLRLKSDHVRVIGKHESKLARFRDFVETTRIDGQTSLPTAAFDVVVDCTGSTSGLPMAIELARPRGTIVMKTTVAGEHRQSLAAVVIHELNLIGSRCGPFDKAIDALAKGEIDVSNLVTHRYPLDRVEQAFSAAVDATYANDPSLRRLKHFKELLAGEGKLRH